MARTTGARDEKKRHRRTMTEKERKRRRENKQRQTENAKARFIATMAAPAPVDLAEENSIQEEDAVQQNDVVYEEVAVNDCCGTTDLGNITAQLDDEWDEDGQTDSVMKAYMKAIMKRYITEDSPDFPKKHPSGEQWLQQFLKNHGFWIRSECAPFICRKLGIQMCELAYYRDVRVWFPDVEGGRGMCMPFCVTCKQQTNVRAHSYPTHHPGRRVTTFNSHYYIMSRQYLCTECKKDHEGNKERANGQTFKKVQFTFMGYHDEVLRRLPDDMKYKFPAVLTHRAGLDKSVVRSLRPLMEKGLRPEVTWKKSTWKPYRRPSYWQN